MFGKITDKQYIKLSKKRTDLTIRFIMGEYNWFHSWRLRRIEIKMDKYETQKFGNPLGLTEVEKRRNTK